MKAPLPEVPPVVLKKRDHAKAPLPSLSVFCGLDAIVVLLLTALHTPHPDFSLFWDWGLNIFAAGVALLVTYYLWRGYGWARGLWVWLTVLTLPFYFFPDETRQISTLEQILTYLNSTLNLFSLVYLNLPGIKAHFAQRKEHEEAVKSP